MATRSKKTASSTATSSSKKSKSHVDLSERIPVWLALLDDETLSSESVLQILTEAAGIKDVIEKAYQHPHIRSDIALSALVTMPQVLLQNPSWPRWLSENPQLFRNFASWQMDHVFRHMAIPNATYQAAQSDASLAAAVLVPATTLRFFLRVFLWGEHGVLKRQLITHPKQSLFALLHYLIMQDPNAPAFLAPAQGYPERYFDLEGCLLACAVLVQRHKLGEVFEIDPLLDVSGLEHSEGAADLAQYQQVYQQHYQDVVAFFRYLSKATYTADTTSVTQKPWDTHPIYVFRFIAEQVQKIWQGFDAIKIDDDADANESLDIAEWRIWKKKYEAAKHDYNQSCFLLESLPFPASVEEAYIQMPMHKERTQIHRLLAQNPYISQDSLRYFVMQLDHNRSFDDRRDVQTETTTEKSNYDQQIVQAILQNPTLSTDLLDVIWQKGWGLTSRFSAHAAVSERLQSEICSWAKAHQGSDVTATDKNQRKSEVAKELLYGLAENPHLSTEVMEHLVSSSVTTLRTWLVHHPRLPPDMLDRLCMDVDEKIREKALQRRG